MEVVKVDEEVVDILQEHAKTLGISEFNVDIQESTNVGDNYIGIVRNIVVNGKRDGTDVKLKWIAKTAPKAEKYREAVCVEIMFEREIYTYKELFPIFDKFQRERCAIELFDSYPEYITSCFEQCKETLILKNMKEEGFFMKNRKKPLEIEFVKLVMQAYGKLHAVSLAIKDQDQELFETIKSKTVEIFFPSLSKKGTDKNDKMFNDKCLAALDPEENRREIEIFEKYSKHYACIKDEIFTKAYDDSYSVIGHGDSWLNNMLFKCGEENNASKPTEVCLLDFQLVRCGSPAFDLSYFLFTCTDKPFRDQHYDQMIRLYYYSLCAHLADLGSDPEKLLPFSILQAHLKRYSVMGLNIAKVVLYLMMSDSEEIPDFKSGAEADEDNLFKTKNESFYSSRMKGIIEDFVEKGYLDFIQEEYEN